MPARNVRSIFKVSAVNALAGSGGAADLTSIPLPRIFVIFDHFSPVVLPEIDLCYSMPHFLWSETWLFQRGDIISKQLWSIICIVSGPLHLLCHGFLWTLHNFFSWRVYASCLLIFA